MDQYQTYGVNVQPQASRETHVTRQLTLTDKAIAELMESVGALNARLSSVLREEIVGIEKSSETKAESMVPLADDLSRKRYQIESIINRINSIRERIEL